MIDTLTFHFPTSMCVNRFVLGRTLVKLHECSPIGVGVFIGLTTIVWCR